MILLGDTHSIRPIFDIIEKNNIENSNIVHVGDVGLGFQEITRDISNLLTLDELMLETGNRIYLCRGNHDHPDFWKKNRIWLPKFHNIIFCEDYSIHKIEERNVLFVGGGISIDRTYRRDMNPPSYWEDEEFVLDIFNENLKQDIDIVITHSAPDFCNPRGVDAPIVNDWAKVEMQYGMNLKGDLIGERSNISALHTTIFTNGNTPTHWCYGHFHSSSNEIIQGTNFIGLNINEIKEI